VRINFLLTAAAAIYGVAGIALLFAPDELLAAAGAPSSQLVAWLAQALGSALFALAFMNWMNRFTRTEGVLGRPVLLPNLFFATTAFWLALGAWRREPGPVLLACAVVLGILAVAFGARLFGRAPQRD
jgi:hypothetical protein